MSDAVIKAIISAAIGLLGWFGARTRAWLDRRKVRRWLKLNTSDRPGRSHVDILTLAKGTRLSEERVRRACMTDNNVYRLPGDPDKWSIWRQETQSIYETRGVLKV
jgi:hypothetical protein